MSERLLVSMAIVLGCALIAAGLFFGLRSRAPSPPPTEALPDMNRVTAEVSRALEGQRAAMTAACVPAGRARVPLSF